MLLAHPLFSALVSRLPRNRFIPLTYFFFAANIVAFWLLFLSSGNEPGIWTGRVFFVWTSVFNLFVVSIFWSLVTDLFRPDQAKRLFGFVAVGGTLGAVTGSSITATLAEALKPVNLLLVSAAILGLSTVVAVTLMRVAPRRAAALEPQQRTEEEPIGGGVLDGIRTALSSNYLLGIVGYMLLYTITATFLYFQQAEIVEAHITERVARTVFFARVDLAVNCLTAVTQIFLTGRIVRRIGIALALAFLPLICVFGFAAVAVAPTLAVIAVVQVLRRAGNYAITRPCREMLFTVLSREAKYKAKNFIDTFIYRAGDQVGAWSWKALGVLGLGIAGISALSIPLSAVWLVLGLWLGRRQREMASGSLAAP
jgi:AAA family ATP:ADP antiporter